MHKLKTIASIILSVTLLVAVAGCEKAQKIEESQTTKKSDDQELLDKQNKALVEMQKNGEVSEFKKIMVTGAIGDGVIAQYLKADGRDFSGTNENNDAQLIDSSTMTEAVAVAAIKQALTTDKTVIVDGSNNAESSTKTKKIMNESVGFSVEGATAYAVSKASNGARTVVPLESILNTEGIKTIDQTKTFFQRNIK